MCVARNGFGYNDNWAFGDLDMKVVGLRDEVDIFAE